MAADRAFLVPVVIDGTIDSEARVPDKFREVQALKMVVPEGCSASPQNAQRCSGFTHPLRGAYRAGDANRTSSFGLSRCNHRRDQRGGLIRMRPPYPRSARPLSATGVLWRAFFAADPIKRKMRICLSNRAMRKLIAGVMLLAFALRATIPQGFMPGSDRPFTVEICPEGFPAQVLMLGGHHHHHGGPNSQTEHCVFGTACANGPPSQLTLLADRSPTEHVRAAPCVAVAAVVRLVYLPHVRGPPSVA